MECWGESSEACPPAFQEMDMEDKDRHKNPLLGGSVLDEWISGSQFSYL